MNFVTKWDDSKGLIKLKARENLSDLQNDSKSTVYKTFENSNSTVSLSEF